jgi:hypothetical protein
MRQLKIKRLKEWGNRRFNYRVIVDGQELFEIANGQERTLTVDNVTTLQAKLMWCGSKELDITTDKEEIKEIRIKANKGLTITFPLTAFVILMTCCVINIIIPDNGLKVYMTSILVGVIVYALALVTIWRNRFLDIELLKE